MEIPNKINVIPMMVTAKIVTELGLFRALNASPSRDTQATQYGKKTSATATENKMRDNGYVH